MKDMYPKEINQWETKIKYLSIVLKFLEIYTGPDKTKDV
jgi:hypothetical protein